MDQTAQALEIAGMRGVLDHPGAHKEQALEDRVIQGMEQAAARASAAAVRGSWTAGSARRPAPAG